MNHKQVTILGVPFIHTNQNDFVQLLKQRIESEQKTFVVTANPEIVMKANEDSNYMDTIKQANYIVADGIGVVKAAKILNQPLPERVTGYDTVMDLLSLANEHRYRIYLLGAKQEVLEKAVNKINTNYPNANIVGSHNGYFDWNHNQIAEEVASLQPDIVLVALGLPRQEQWIAQHIANFNKGIFIGVGGVFDALAGEVKRAPEIWQKLNLEWFYRLVKQPSRWKRMLVLPHFVMKIYGQKVKGRK